jgi:hypothetical protein
LLRITQYNKPILLFDQREREKLLLFDPSQFGYSTKERERKVVTVRPKPILYAFRPKRERKVVVVRPKTIWLFDQRERKEVVVVRPKPILYAFRP